MLPVNAIARRRQHWFIRFQKSVKVITRSGAVEACRIFNGLGMTALRLTLPYHEERKPPELERAEHLVGSNIGRTIQSMRQAVLDTRAAVRWLRQEGFERIGILGTSIGLVIGEKGSVPHVGERLSFRGIEVEVLVADEKRIGRVRLQRSNAQSAKQVTRTD